MAYRILSSQSWKVKVVETTLMTEEIISVSDIMVTYTYNFTSDAILNSSLSANTISNNSLHWSGLLFGILVISLTIIGNVMVILAICVEKKLRKTSNVFVANLSFCDLLVGIVVMPIALLYHSKGQWKFSSFLCDVWVCLDIICCTASIISICLISYDRYCAITKPLHYAYRKSKRKATLMIFAVWGYSFLIGTPPLFGWKGKELTFENTCMVTTLLSYTIFSLLGAFYLPLIILYIMYVKIYCATKSRQKRWVMPLYVHRTANEKGFRRKSDFAVYVTATQSIIKRQKAMINQDKKKESKKDVEKSQEKQFNFATILQSKWNKQKTDLSNSSNIPSITLDDFSCDVNCNETTNLRIYMKPKYDGTSKKETMISMNNSTCGLSNFDDKTSTHLMPDTIEMSLDEVKANEKFWDEVRPVDSYLGVKNFETVKRRLSEPNLSSNKDITFAAPPKNYRKSESFIFSRSKRLSKYRISWNQDRTVAQTLGIIMGGFTACWLPFFLMQTIAPVCGSCGIPAYVEEIFTWLGYFNSTLNPIIYTCLNSDFRRAYLKILCLKRTKKY